jgi:hypothetical protein
LAARVALRMASEENWPAKRRSAQDVEDILDSPDYREYTEFSTKVRAYYQENE